MLSALSAFSFSATLDYGPQLHSLHGDVSLCALSSRLDVLCVQRCHSEVVHSFLLFVVTHSPSMLENTQRPFLLSGCFVLIRIQKVQICGDVLMLLVPRPSNHEPASWQSERASSVCLWRLFASESPKSQSVGEARIQNCIAPDTFSQKSLKFFQVSPKAVSQLLMGFPYFAVYLVCENAKKISGCKW